MHNLCRSADSPACAHGRNERSWKGGAGRATDAAHNCKPRNTRIATRVRENPKAARTLLRLGVTRNAPPSERQPTAATKEGHTAGAGRRGARRFWPERRVARGACVTNLRASKSIQMRESAGALRPTRYATSRGKCRRRWAPLCTFRGVASRRVQAQRLGDALCSRRAAAQSGLPVQRPACAQRVQVQTTTNSRGNTSSAAASSPPFKGELLPEAWRNSPKHTHHLTDVYTALHLAFVTLAFPDERGPADYVCNGGGLRHSGRQPEVTHNGRRSAVFSRSPSVEQQHSELRSMLAAPWPSSRQVLHACNHLVHSRPARGRSPSKHRLRR